MNSTRKQNPALTVLLGGLLAGALDITYAFVYYTLYAHSNPGRVLQSIAAGICGMASFQGGAATMALGLFFQFFISCTAAFVFYAATFPLPFLVRRPVIWGAAFGIGVYLVMNFVVIPLSRFPRKVTFPLPTLITGLLVHMFLIGVPIALAARRARTGAA